VRVVLNWEAIARADVHRLRVAILEQMATPPPNGDPGWSASTLATALGAALAATSHHVRTLRDRGLVTEAGRRRTRGTVQTFYVLSRAALDG
jgi:DNA-binding transcriptional ArsR family regulator